MPQQNRPITERPTVEDESTGTGSERHGKHREADEALPGRGSEKGGMNRDSGREDDAAGSSRGTQQSQPNKPGPA